MYNNKSVLALITARGGSKGIPRKNVKALGGKPLICWTIHAALKSCYIDRLILSSDDPVIIDVARRAGCEVPFQRPVNLAKDNTPSIDVIEHALDNLNEIYDYILLLQPTSPFRTSYHIDEIIRLGVDENMKMIVSVARLHKHPAHMYYDDQGFLRPIISGHTQLRRQDMPLAYEHNGALYLADREFLRAKRSYNTEETRFYEMSGPANLDIDDAEDWNYAEYLVAQGLYQE